MTPTSVRDPEARYKVLVADRVSPSGLRALTEDNRFHVTPLDGLEGSEVEAALADADAIIVRSATQVTRDLMDAAPSLKAIGRAGVGVDNIDLKAATERGIPVMNAPAGNTVSAAELTLALLLATARKVVEADRSIREGEWKRSALKGFELRGKILGLVGAGRIGGEVARRAQAFGMDVLAFDPYLTAERASDLRMTLASLDEVLERSDFMSLHVPLTDATRGMIGGAELGRMKPSAILINAARGGVVVEAALAQALKEGRLRGAALDVYEAEPLAPDSALRDAPNLVLTPHLGASTADAQELVAVEIAEAVKSALLEGDLTRALNAPAIGGEALRTLRPMLTLAERAGLLASVLSSGGIQEVGICVAGSYDPSFERPLTAAVLTGILRRVQGADQVNFVNALHMAETRGIRIRTAHTSRRSDFSEVLEITIDSEGGRVTVVGAMLGEGHPRIVGIDDFSVDVIPEGSLVVLVNRDVPGVIGRVGTLLGEHELNIAEYHQSRRDAEGDALAVISIDGSVDSAVIESLKAMPEIVGVWVADLG